MTESQKPNELNDLNDVLIEFGVLLTNMDARRTLLGPLMRAGTTDVQLREACMHLKRVDGRNLSLRIKEMIDEDPRLRAVLQSAGKYRRNTAPPRTSEIAEDSKREQLNTEAQEDRLAMRAYQDMRHRNDRPSPQRLARELNVTSDRLGDLIEKGAEMYGVPGKLARWWLMRNDSKALGLWLMKQQRGTLSRKVNERYLENRLKDAPAEVLEQAANGILPVP